MCISETWHNEYNLHCAYFDGYYLASYFHRTIHKHGGVAVYVKTSYEIRELKHIADLSLEKNIELCGISIPKFKLNCIVLYRPEGDFDYFLKTLNAVLESTQNNNFNTVICGDFNVNFLNKLSQKRITIDDLFVSHRFKCLIKEPTRITDHSFSLIDNIVTNVCDSSIVYSGNIKTPFSDHDAQILKLAINTTKSSPQSIYISKRYFSIENKIYFNNLLKSESWMEVFMAETVDLKF